MPICQEAPESLFWVTRSFGGPLVFSGLRLKQTKQPIPPCNNELRTESFVHNATKSIWENVLLLLGLQGSFRYSYIGNENFLKNRVLKGRMTMEEHNRENEQAGEDRLMTVREVARYLSIHEMTLYALIHETDIPTVKLGGQWRFKKSRLDQWLSDRMDRGGEIRDFPPGERYPGRRKTGTDDPP
jgi:excisionase family DNA binding protein